jgi:hypothetical protein
LQLLSNAASAPARALGFVIRWPLLGVVVGTVLAQKTRPVAARSAARVPERRWVVAPRPVIGTGRHRDIHEP